MVYWLTLNPSPLTLNQRLPLTESRIERLSLNPRGINRN